MNAVPKIAARPLIHPVYVMTESLDTFVEINRVVLHDWYVALREAGELEDDLVDFAEFCAVQYDIACEQVVAMPHYSEQFDDRSFEEVMEDMTGKPARGPL